MGKLVAVASLFLVLFFFGRKSVEAIAEKWIDQDDVYFRLKDMIDEDEATRTSEPIWPPQMTDACTQTTKQKAMYGSFVFSPSLKVKPLTKVSVIVRWDDLRFAPYNKGNKGGVYAAYTMKQGDDGPGGYFGVQLANNRGQFLFSLWDVDQSLATQATWPLNLDRCKRNCNDCGHKTTHKMTTGTQCKLVKPDMKVGDKYEITLAETRKVMTINTADYGGMPSGERNNGVVDHEITGSVWMVSAKDMKTGLTEEVGSILFKGEARGMVRLGTFDEMLGCRGCNMLHHKDTRWGPYIQAEDSSQRTPLSVRGKTKAHLSTCKKYFISGAKEDLSMSFEGGPFTDPYPTDGKGRVIW